MPFLKTGLLRWTQLRRQWVDHKKSKHRTKAQEPVLRKVTYESLLGTSKNFPRSIPLSVSRYFHYFCEFPNMPLNYGNPPSGNGWILGGHMGARRVECVKCKNTK
uniref:DUF4050 domain-containing protein n=1 Tax=Lactuca sativa TaxID=4236 RepID=A0A9R1X2E8_LACSA|nr:hypothetical protein LSAT_V11C700359960 [Lactuca sativa]